MTGALWPAARAARAIETLARGARFPLRPSAAPEWPDAPANDPLRFGRFVEDAAAAVGVEAEPVDVRYADVDQILRGAAPVLLVIEGAELRLLAVLGARGGTLRLLGADGPARMPLAEARDLLRAGVERDAQAEIDALLVGARLTASGPRRARLRAALLADRLADRSVARAFRLRDPPSVGLARAARRLGLAPRLGALFGLHAVEYLLGLLAWVIVGRGALSGRLDARWLGAWLLVRAALIPFELSTTWMSGSLAVDVGAFIKKRLLAGALALDPEAIRDQGVGRFLGIGYEASAIEKMGIGGGFAAVLAIVELGASAVVLALGAGGLLHAGLLVAWTFGGAALGWRTLVLRRAWTAERLGLTYDLVERLVGHRTRLAQEDPATWHDEEDRALEAYLAHARALDGAQVTLGALLPWGWLVVGMVGLFVAFAARGSVADSDAAAASLATGLGGVLLARRAFGRLAEGLTQIAGAIVAWRVVKPLFAAAARPPVPASPEICAAPRAADGEIVAAADALTFGYPGRPRPVLRGASLTVRAGERVLVQGSSGGGKSTLASLLAGLRAPSSGSLRLGGFDRAALGTNGWRHCVVSAPQFHENHVFSATFAFNLLLGRRWPPVRADVEEAEGVCRALGLGPLIDRMPAGLSQMVGETGWQLSHGERSRLYIARALLQGTDLLLLDESFAALDPPTLERAMACVLERARTLVVIAHP